MCGVSQRAEICVVLKTYQNDTLTNEYFSRAPPHNYEQHIRERRRYERENFDF